MSRRSRCRVYDSKTARLLGAPPVPERNRRSAGSVSARPRHFVLCRARRRFRVPGRQPVRREYGWLRKDPGPLLHARITICHSASVISGFTLLANFRSPSYLAGESRGRATKTDNVVAQADCPTRIRGFPARTSIFEIPPFSIVWLVRTPYLSFCTSEAAQLPLLQRSFSLQTYSRRLQEGCRTM